MAHDDSIKAAIINHMKKTYHLAIGERMAERIKFDVGSAIPMGNNESTMEILGRDMTSAQPKKTVVALAEIHEVIRRGR